MDHPLCKIYSTENCHQLKSVLGRCSWAPASDNQSLKLTFHRLCCGWKGSHHAHHQWGLDALGWNLWNTKKKDISNKGLVFTCSKSKGSYKTHGKINQNSFESNVELRAVNYASLQDFCSNTVLPASLGHFYRTSSDCSTHTHPLASMDTGVCNIPFPEIRKKAENKGKKLLFKEE